MENTGKNYTWDELLKFALTLSKEELSQPVLFDESDEVPLIKIQGVFKTTDDFYVDNDNPENVDTLKGHEENSDESEPYHIERFTLCTPKGTLFLS